MLLTTVGGWAEGLFLCCTALTRGARLRVQSGLVADYIGARTARAQRDVRRRPALTSA
jgi:hypothetical protein